MSDDIYEYTPPSITVVVDGQIYFDFCLDEIPLEYVQEGSYRLISKEAYRLL